MSYDDATALPVSDGDSLSSVPSATMAEATNQKTTTVTTRAAAANAPAARKNNEKLHLIDENLALSDKVGDFLRDVNLYNSGFNYNLVAIFGSQSTGKSTLLNMLFETTFDVMQAERRQQTTKGLWLSCGTPNTTLVLDVEGTDGRERGEDQDMERKSALFSLAVAEVVIVNMFEQDVGRYNGANYGLLKTVFEVNLQLFLSKGSPRTLLLFIIRDHTQTPLESMEKTLREDMNKIWSDLAKPEGVATCQLGDYFDLSFVALPHKVYVPKEFNEGVNKLRRWFCDSSNPNYLFKSQYSRRIPADGFEKFASSVWSEIMSNHELDLPTQRQLLAEYRCTEIMRGTVTEFKAIFKPLELQVDTGVIITDLGVQMEVAIKSALDKFDSLANRYDNTTYLKIRQELLATLHTNLGVLYSAQLRNLLAASSGLFEQTFDKGVGKNSDAFMDAAQAAKIEAEQFFRMRASAITLEGTDWSYADVLKLLAEDIDVIIQRRRVQELVKLRDESKKMLQELVIAPINDHLSSAGADMWQRMQESINEAGQKLQSKLDRRLTGLRPTEQEHRSVFTELIKEARAAILKRLQEEVSQEVFVTKLRKTFERAFRYDGTMKPRSFVKPEEVSGCYDDAWAKTTAMLELHTVARLDLSTFDAPLSDDERVLIKPARKNAITEDVLLYANTQFSEAKSAAGQTLSNVPMWAWLLLFIFAWNDFLAFFSDPFSTVFNLLLFAMVVYGGYYAIEFFELKKPLSQAMQSATRKAVVLAGTAAVQAATNAATSGTAGANPFSRSQSVPQTMRQPSQDDTSGSTSSSSSSVSAAGMTRRHTKT